MVDAAELARLIGEFGKAYTRRLCAEMEQAGTTPARAQLLSTLQRQGTCTMCELSNRLGVTPRNVTKLVDGMEQEGLVRRQPHPHDRRATLVTLTERGVSVCKESNLAIRAAAALFEQLDSADRQHLARILRRLITLLGEPGHR